MRIIKIDGSIVHVYVNEQEFTTYMKKMENLRNMFPVAPTTSYKENVVIEQYVFRGTFPLRIEADFDRKSYQLDLSYDNYYNIIHAFLTETYSVTDHIRNAVHYAYRHEILGWYDDPMFRKRVTLEKLKKLIEIIKEEKQDDRLSTDLILKKATILYMSDIIRDTVRIGRTVDTKKWTPSDVVAKLAEETGELARAVQIKNGKLPSKTQEDGEEIRECADVINCAIDAISQVNRNLSDEELIFELLIAMSKKNKKWESVMFKKDNL